MNTSGSLQALLRAGTRSIEQKFPHLFRKAKPAKTHESAAPTTSRPGSVRIFESVKVLEAMKDGPNGEKIFKVVLISKGLGNLRNKNYYGDEAIESSVKVFEGRFCYLNHQDEDEAQKLPERRVQDKAGFYKNLTLLEDKGVPACGGELHCDLSESGKMLADKLASALLYKKHFPDSDTEYVGLSVNADGDAEPRTMDVPGQGELDVNYVTAITEADSCDLVTTPARGGRGLAAIKEDKAGGVNLRSQEDHGMKKKLEAFLAKFSEAFKSLGDEDKKKLAESQKALAALVKESEGEGEGKAEGESENYEGLFAKKEGESDEDHLKRLHGMAKALTGHIAKVSGDEPAPEDEDEGADAQESKRDAIASLIKESGLPEGVYDKAELARLAKLPYREAKAIISKDAKLAKSIRESVGEPVASLHRGAAAGGQDVTASFVEAARGE
jgi:hypothetical protein